MVRACESYSGREKASLWLASSTFVVSTATVVASAALSRYTEGWKPYVGIGAGSIGLVSSSYILWKVAKDESAPISEPPPPFPKSFFNTQTELGVDIKDIPDKYFVRFHCRQGGEDARYAAYHLDLLPDTCPGCCDPLSEKDQRILYHATRKITREDIDAFIENPLVPAQHVSDVGTLDYVDFGDVPAKIRAILPSGHIEAVTALKKIWADNPDLDGKCYWTKQTLPGAYVRKIKTWRVSQETAIEWDAITYQAEEDEESLATWKKRVDYFLEAATELGPCQNFAEATPKIARLQERLAEMPDAEERFFHDLVMRPKGQPSLRVGAIWARFTAIAEEEEAQQGPAISALSVALWDLWHRLQDKDHKPPSAIQELLPKK